MQSDRVALVAHHAVLSPTDDIGVTLHVHAVQVVTMGVVHLQMVEGCTIATLVQDHRVLPALTNPTLCCPLAPVVEPRFPKLVAPCWTLNQAQLGSFHS